MPITFDIVARIQEKLHFWTPLVNTFRMICNLVGFAEVRILGLFFGNDVIITLFVIVDLSNLHIL